jgi:hypothetical protein
MAGHSSRWSFCMSARLPHPPPIRQVRRARSGPGLALAAALALTAAPALGWDATGSHPVLLHHRDGGRIHLGTVDFTPAADGRTAFVLKLAQEPFKDFFLSMKEFKCVESPAEVFCHVPYPYPQPGTVQLTSATPDLAWLEHALLFMFKTPAEFGAKLWNGVYFQLKLTGRGLEGTPQAVDLNRISAPPDKPGVPPYRPALRDDIAPGARFFNRLTIE